MVESDLGGGLFSREWSATRLTFGAKSPDGTYWIVEYAIGADDREKAEARARHLLKEWDELEAGA